MSKWISVKDRLPTDDDYYLIFSNDPYYLEDGSYNVAFLHKEESYSSWRRVDFKAIYEVTHYMPLPATPIVAPEINIAP